MTLPDFFILGAPKAGTTALHAALANHPGLHLASVKEPKYFMCGDRRPDRAQQRGPGDAHSAREWVWRRADYEALFAGAPAGTLTGESTPFYLYDRQAHSRIHRNVPNARLIVLLRDPADRAYSNWMHLRSDGLEPIPDLLQAVGREESRRAAGWAPMWHYRGLGLYGAQLRDLYEVFAREQVLVLRYRQLVDEPNSTLATVARFLGVEPGDSLPTAPPANVKQYVADSARTRSLGRLVRTGAWAGQFVPPQVWRQAQRPLIAALQRAEAVRPQLAPQQRRVLTEAFADDIALLQELTGQDFSDWLSHQGRGSFSARQARDPRD